MKLEFCCPTLFGLEGIVADELRFEGKLEDVRAENGRVFFSGDFKTLAWANINLRCAERVLILLKRFKAENFEQLFDETYKIDWADWIGINDQFPVKGHILNSKINSLPHTQAMIKKAIVKKLESVYKVSWFEEIGVKIQIQFSIMNDIVEIFLDTSGAGLHKRGYREISNEAPLRETLAAAMVKIARFKGKEPLIDPFCGSGTIAIEAAMIAQKRPAGIKRRFASEKWGFIPKQIWEEERKKALYNILTDIELDILGSDIDDKCTQIAISNAQKAGVSKLVRFETKDAIKIDYTNMKGFLFANPPYGERLLDLYQAQTIPREIGKTLKKSQLKQYYLTSDEKFEYIFGCMADKKRKLYNGMIKCDLYMYFKLPEQRKFLNRAREKLNKPYKK